MVHVRLDVCCIHSRVHGAMQRPIYARASSATFADRRSRMLNARRAVQILSVLLPPVEIPVPIPALPSSTTSTEHEAASCNCEGTAMDDGSFDEECSR